MEVKRIIVRKLILIMAVPTGMYIADAYIKMLHPKVSRARRMSGIKAGVETLIVGLTISRQGTVKANILLNRPMLSWNSPTILSSIYRKQEKFGVILKKINYKVYGIGDIFGTDPIDRPLISEIVGSNLRSDQCVGSDTITVLVFEGKK